MCELHVFFISNSFISNVRLDWQKIKQNQHPEAELLLFENHSLFSSTLSSKNNRRYSKKCAEKQVHPFKRGYMINDNQNEAENKK